MFHITAKGSTVVIGEHVLHADRPTLFPVVPPELSERPDLVTITEALDEPATTLNTPSELTAEGVDLSAVIGGDPGDNPDDDAGEPGVTLLRVEDEDEDEAGGAPALTPDPFADDDAPGPGTPAAALPRTRTSSGGRKK